MSNSFLNTLFTSRPFCEENLSNVDNVCDKGKEPHTFDLDHARSARRLRSYVQHIVLFDTSEYLLKPILKHIFKSPV